MDIQEQEKMSAWLKKSDRSNSSGCKNALIETQSTVEVQEGEWFEHSLQGLELFCGDGI